MKHGAKAAGKGGKRPATIADVARLAGVSGATVSYVLNGRSGVSDAVRERVMAVVKRMGYVQNLRAKGLKTHRSYTIHAVIRKEAAPACKTFYFGVVACIAEMLSSGGYSVAPVFQSDDDGDSALTDLIRNGGTDGVIAFQGVSPHLESALSVRGVPYVIINPGFEAEPDAVSVKIDFEELSHRAAAYLISLGHTDIAFIGMRRLPFFFSATKRGFRKAMKARGLTARREWIRGEADCAEGAAGAMRKILDVASAEERDPPTAVLCTQDNFAISAMSAAREAGYRVPEDISFIGIDDVPEARYIEPALTTIPISPQTLAEEAMTRLFAMIEGEQTESITVPSNDIIERASVNTRRNAEAVSSSEAV